MFFTRQFSLGKHFFCSIPEKIPDYITLLTKEDIVESPNGLHMYFVLIKEYFATGGSLIEVHTIVENVLSCFLHIVSRQY